MKIDHTKEIEQRVDVIQINELDSCLFYTPKEGSLLVVSLCAYCKFGDFADKNKNGYCKYHLDNNRR